MVYNPDNLKIRMTEEFAKWLNRLRDADARARINLRIRRASLTGNIGDCKSIGDGIGEMRIDYGPGYRLYVARRGSDTVLLLIGGDKESQQRDIEKAKKLNKQYE